MNSAGSKTTNPLARPNTIAATWTILLCSSAVFVDPKRTYQVIQRPGKTEIK